MKRLLLALAIIAFFCAGGHAQLRPTVKPQLMPYSYYQFPGYLQADSGILLPVRTPSFTPKRRGTLVYNTADSTPHYWSGYSWFPMASQSWANKLFYSTATFDTSSRVLSLVNGSGTTSLVIPRGGNVGGLSSLSYARAGDMINILGDNGASVRFSLRDADSSSRMLYSDTTAMLSGYGRSGQLVKYSDTAAQLSNLLRKSDTTGMLSGYGRSGQLVKYSDTAAQLTGYARSGQVVKYSDTAAQVSNLLRKSDTTAMLSGYGRSGQLVKYSDTAAQLTGYARSGQVVKYSDTTAQLSNYRRKTTIIENSDLRNSTISGVSLGNSLSSLNWGYGFTSGTSYNGSSAVSQGLDTTAVSTKANVTALLLGKQNLIGYTPENAANKGAANGYAPLGSDVKIATTYLPAITMNNVYSASSQSAMLSLSAVVGDMCVRTDSSISYVLQVAAPSNPAAWVKVLSPAAPVSSVNGKTGVVSLLTSDISEGGTSYFWTAARSRAAQSSSIAAISYDNSTGTFSLVAGYYIPSTTDQSNWNVAYNRRLSSASLSASTLTLTLADASTITASVPTFNQNTTGNAATATLAANSTQWNGLTYGSGSSITNYMMAYAGGGVYYPATVGQIQSFLGLGSNAYTSDIHAPSFGTLSNANSLYAGGFFSGYNPLNIPAGQSSNDWGIINMPAWGGNNTSTHYNVQFAANLDANNSVFIRKSYAGDGSGSWYTLLHSGNYSNYALPLSGGTVTGNIKSTSSGSNVIEVNTTSSGSIPRFDLTYNSTLIAGMSANISTGEIKMGAFYSGGYYPVIYSNGSPALTFGTGGNATLANSLNTGGNVNIPNTSRLQFNSGDVAITNSGTNLYLQTYNGTSLVTAISVNNSQIVTCTNSVYATAFYESSDIRLKRLHIIENSKDGINAIQYTFRPSGTDKWGYSAQQVRKILPYAVTTGEDGFLKVDYTTVHTFKIMKLEKRIEELEQLTRKLLLQQIQSPKGN